MRILSKEARRKRENIKMEKLQRANERKEKEIKLKINKAKGTKSRERTNKVFRLEDSESIVPE